MGNRNCEADNCESVLWPHDISLYSPPYFWQHYINNEGIYQEDNTVITGTCGQGRRMRSKNIFNLFWGFGGF
jgi:hypothetical protein